MKPKKSRNNNTIFLIGAILTIIGGGFATIVPYSLYFYYLPVILLLIGLTLIWLTKRKIITKIIWTISPVVFFFGFQAIWYQLNKVDPEIFLIKEDYRGKIHVIFNQECGIPEEWEGRTRIYSIPESGILLTQFEDEQGWIDQNYFFIDSNGSRTKIPNLDVRDFNEEWTTVKNPNEPSRDSLGVFHAGRVYSDGTYEFYISTYRNLTEEYDFKYERNFDTLKMEIINDCK
jgi:hypothetical protein